MGSEFPLVDPTGKLEFPESCSHLMRRGFLSLSTDNPKIGWMLEESGSDGAILHNHQRNVDSKCLPDRQSHRNTKLNCTVFALCNPGAIFPSMVSSHHYSSSYFSKLHLAVILSMVNHRTPAQHGTEKDPPVQPPC